MAAIPVQIILNPATRRSIAYNPQNLSLSTLDPDFARRLNMFAAAGHDDAALDPAELRRWEGIEAALAGVNGQDPAAASQEINQLVLSNTYHCNMGCTYCYNELDSKPIKGSESPGGMTWATAKRALDDTIAGMAPGSSLKLMFIGGEPLLEYNLMVTAVAYAEAECAAKGVGLGVVVYTNATLIKQTTLDWLGQHQISVVVSLDGPGSLNLNRVYLSGRPTTRIVLRNIKRLITSDSQVIRRVRAVSTPNTPIVALHRYLLGLGFNEIHVQPMYDNDGISAVPMDDMVGLLDWWRDLMLNDIVIDINPFSAYLLKLMNKGASAASWHPCTAGRNAVTVGPDGRIYSCHHAIEEPEYQMGHVDQGMPTLDVRKNFFRTVEEREPCSRCWAKHVCGGECYHRADAAGKGQFGTLPAECRTRKSLIGMAMDTFATIAQENPMALAKLARGMLAKVQPDERAYAAEDLTSFVAP